MENILENISQDSRDQLRILLEEPNELTDIVDSYLEKGYTLNGHSTNKELILYLLTSNGTVKLVKKRRFLFWKFNSSINITG